MTPGRMHGPLIQHQDMGQFSAAAVWKGKILLCGGSDRDDVEEYDPDESKRVTMYRIVDLNVMTGRMYHICVTDHKPYIGNYNLHFVISFALKPNQCYQGNHFSENHHYIPGEKCVPFNL